MSIQSISFTQFQPFLETASQSRIYLGRLYQWLVNTRVARHSDSIAIAFLVAATSLAILKGLPKVFPNQDDGRPLSDMRVEIRQSYDNFMITHPRFEFGWHEMFTRILPVILFCMTLKRLTESNPAELAHSLRFESILRDIHVYSTAIFLLRLPIAFLWIPARDRIPYPIGPFLSRCLQMAAPRGLDRKPPNHLANN